VTEPILHLAIPGDWNAARDSGEYRISTRGLDLDEVGFVHCSTPDQMEFVANTFYDDLDELIVLTIDPDSVGSPVRWEPPVPGSEELFPHVYGPLPLDAIPATRTWRRGSGGWVLSDL